MGRDPGQDGIGVEGILLQPELGVQAAWQVSFFIKCLGRLDFKQLAARQAGLGLGLQAAADPVHLKSKALTWLGITADPG